MKIQHNDAVVKRRDRLDVDPRKLKIEPGHNVRDMHSAETRAKVEWLKSSIRSRPGVHKDLEVRKVGDDIYVTDGECRLTACMELISEGFEIYSIPCVVEQSGTKELERKLNLGRANSGGVFNALETAEWVRQCKRLGATEQQIADAKGWASTASVKQSLKVAELPPELESAVAAGKISATLARKMVDEVGPEEAVKIFKEGQAQAKRDTGKDRVRPRHTREATAAKKPPKADKIRVPPPRQAAPAPEPEAPAAAPQVEPPTVPAQTHGNTGVDGRSTPEVIITEVARTEERTPAPVQPVEPPRSQLNGFFQSCEPIAKALADWDLSEVLDNGSVLIELTGAEAKRFSAAWLKATGGEQS